MTEFYFYFVWLPSLAKALEVLALLAVLFGLALIPYGIVIGADES